MAYLRGKNHAVQKFKSKSWGKAFKIFTKKSEIRWLHLSLERATSESQSKRDGGRTGLH